MPVSASRVDCISFILVGKISIATGLDYIHSAKSVYFISKILAFGGSD